MNSKAWDKILSCALFLQKSRTEQKFDFCCTIYKLNDILETESY